MNVLILACVGTLISPANKASADTTVFQSGQVFASVGGSMVNVYDQNSGDLVNTLTDSTNDPFTAGSALLNFIRSTMPSVADRAGTNEPICARITSSADWRR